MDDVNPFLEHETGPDAIAEAGQRFLTLKYGSKRKETLDKLRFDMFAQSLIKTNFNLAYLPPTKEAARQHCFRAYLQVQMWLGNQMEPLERV